jgi:hypothetical protein
MLEEPLMLEQQANGIDHELPPQGNTNPLHSSVLPSSSFLEVKDQAELVRPIHDLPKEGQKIHPRISGWIVLGRPVPAFVRPSSEVPSPPAVPSVSSEQFVPHSDASAKDLELAGEVALFREIMSDWGLGEQEASAILGYKEPTFATDLFKGLTSIRQRDADERLQLVITIAVDLEALYRDYDVIKKWLRKPHELLNGAIPLKMATEGTSLDLFKLSEYIEYLSGR